MIVAQHTSAQAHEYFPGDLVIISTRVLPLRVPSAQARKLTPKWIGLSPIITEVNPGAYQIATPDAYKLNHDVFNVIDIRPWLSHSTHSLDPDCPPVTRHPLLNPVLKILDRKQCAWRPKQCHLLDIPTQYLVRIA
jgi:hypothetical protein